MTVKPIVLLVLSVFDTLSLTRGVLVNPVPVEIGKRMLITLDFMEIKRFTGLSIPLRNISRVYMRKMIDIDERRRVPNYVFAIEPVDSADIASGVQFKSFFAKRNDIFVKYKFKKGEEIAILFEVRNAKCNDIGVVEFEVDINLMSTGENIIKKNYEYLDFTVRKPYFELYPAQGPYEIGSYVTISCSSNATVKNVQLELWIQTPSSNVAMKMPVNSKLMGWSYSEKYIERYPEWPPHPLVKQVFRRCTVCKDLDQYEHRVYTTFRIDFQTVLDSVIKCKSKVTAKFKTMDKLAKKMTEVQSTEIQLRKCTLGPCGSLPGAWLPKSAEKSPFMEIVLQRNIPKAAVGRPPPPDYLRLQIMLLVVLPVAIIAVTARLVIRIVKRSKRFGPSGHRRYISSDDGETDERTSTSADQDRSEETDMSMMGSAAASELSFMSEETDGRKMKQAAPYRRDLEKGEIEIHRMDRSISGIDREPE